MIITKQAAPTTQFSSRFQIGDAVFFQPNLALIDARTGKTDPNYAATAEIAGVAFSASKVYYNIDVLYTETYSGSSTQFRMRLDGVPSDMIVKP